MKVIRISFPNNRGLMKSEAVVVVVLWGERLKINTTKYRPLGSILDETQVLVRVRFKL